MANTYVWKINDLQRDLADGFAHTAHWTVVAISDQVDSEGNPYNTGAYDSTRLDRPDTLADFEDLTEDQIMQLCRPNLVQRK